MTDSTARVPEDRTVSINESELDARAKRQRTAVERDGNSSFSSIHGAPKPSTMTTRSETFAAHDKSRKLGHRRVNEAGEVTYKKKPTSELMAAIQLGIGQSITSLVGKPKRDLLLQDFSIVETVYFPKEGSSLTPAHECSDFRFRTYASVAFRYFRELFGIQPDDFLVSLCNSPLRAVTNPGASGSIFYISADDEFIVKTVQHKEAEFLQKLLPGYYMNQNQNPRTLLPKFYGLYCYQCGGKNIRFIVMNNLMPSSIRMHEKYDLKGSTYKRKASRTERAKSSPTLKDLDFIELHSDGGLMLEAETYSALVKTIERDCRVMQSFQIMDYSLLLCVHNLDLAVKERESREQEVESPSSPRMSNATESNASGVTRGRSFHQRLAQFSTTMEAIQAKTEPLEIDETQIPPGGIPARSYRGERLLLYLGIIDILQSYRIGKKLEHAFKAIVHDGDTISVHRPGFYAQRFQTFFANTVFKKVPSLDQPQVKGPHVRFKKLVQIAMKQSPAGRKPECEEGNMCEEEDGANKPDYEPGGAVGGRPDVLPTATPPPTASMVELNVAMTTASSSPARTAMSTPSHTSFTEGTPSYTPSSSSCSSDVGTGPRSSGRLSARSADAERLVVELAARGSVAIDQLSNRLNETLSTDGTSPALQ